MKVRLTEDRLRGIIREVVEDIVNGDSNNDITIAKRIITKNRNSILKAVYRYFEDEWDFSGMNYWFDDRSSNDGISYGYAEEDIDDIECDIIVSDDTRLSVCVGCRLNSTVTAGDPGDYWTAPTYDNYEYKVSDIYVNYLYYYDSNSHIELDMDNIYIPLND